MTKTAQPTLSLKFRPVESTDLNILRQLDSFTARQALFLINGLFTVKVNRAGLKKFVPSLDMDVQGMAEFVFLLSNPAADMAEDFDYGVDWFRALALREVADKVSPIGLYHLYAAALSKYLETYLPALAEYLDGVENGGHLPLAD